MFPRHVIDPAGHHQPPNDAQVLWIASDQGPVEAWILPGDGVSEASPGPAVIFAHGNAELIDRYPPRLQPYRDAGITVVLCEYRGYGRSAGSPSEKRIVEDFAKCHAALIARDDVDPSRIVFHGRSLGGGVVCALSRRHRPAAIILQSTFSSLKAVARDHHAPAWLLADQFDNHSALEQYDGPVLIMHGRRDTIIPFHHAESLTCAAKSGRIVSFDADHNDPLPQDAYWRAIVSFLKKEQLISSSSAED